jgi:hypothetical protein
MGEACSNKWVEFGESRVIHEGKQDLDRSFHTSLTPLISFFSIFGGIFGSISKANTTFSSPYTVPLLRQQQYQQWSNTALQPFSLPSAFFLRTMPSATLVSFILIQNAFGLIHIG